MISNVLIRNSLVGFCLKILNSTVVIGLYYGFLSTASIGPSYLFLIRARVMEKGSETEIAATTGFLTGRVMMFISIYYAPLHLSLNRPHTLTYLTIPYLFFNYVYKNNQHYYSGEWGWEYTLDSGSKNPNPLRNFRTYKVFFNNLFFQLLNPLLFPSSILIRLMTIYLFRSNNKLLFLTSSFVGWLIGHIFLMKCIGWVLVWLKKKNSIKSKITMRFDKYILLQLRNYMGEIFVVFAFVIFAHYLGRGPLPIFFSDEMSDQDNMEREETQDIIDAEREQNNEEDITVYFSDNEKTSNNMNIQKKTKLVPLEKRSLVNILFDYQRWTRPLRYIKNDHFERVVRDENSQFFFQTCESDGKKRISFTYPPHLSTFRKMMEKKMDLFIRTDKTSYNDNELYNSWISINKEKKNKLSNELFQRAKILDKKGNKMDLVDVLENRIRLSDDRSKKKYLPKIYDPFLNGPARGEIQKSVSPFITNQTYTTNSILINRIHGLLFCMNSNSPEFEQKIDKFDRKLLFTEMVFFFKLISKFSEKSVSTFNFDGLYVFPEHEQVKIYSEEKKRKRNFLFDAIRTNPMNHTTIFHRKLCSEINEISKEVPRWSYELVDDFDVLMDRNPKDAQIRCEKAERVVMFNTETMELGPNVRNNTYSSTYDGGQSELNEYAVTNYGREPDFDREIIRGSVRAQRRKTVTSKFFQGNGNVHSPLFVDVVRESYPFFLRDIFEEIWENLKEYFRKPGTDNSEFLEFQTIKKEREQTLKDQELEDQKDEDELRLKKIEEDWESLLYGLIIRSFVLVFQSRFRKYIVLPSLIITKNIIRMLLFQNPEWSEDFRDWRREIHINCTYQGSPLYNNEFTIRWLLDGIQIRVLHPFVLKPWHNKPKVRSTKKKKKSTQEVPLLPFEKNFRFLTGYGTLVESYLEEHVPNPFSFLGPILNKITKQLKKDLINRFGQLNNLYKERKRKKESRILLEELKEMEIKKNSPISKSNPMIEESPLIIQSIIPIPSTDKRIKDIHVKTKTILKQIEKITEEKKEGVITDAKRLELLKNSFKILKRRNVRLIRKSYLFFQLFMERLYIRILVILTSNYVKDFFTSVEDFLTYNIVQRYRNYIKLSRSLFELTKKIVTKFIYKNEQSVDQSIIEVLSIIDKYKPWNITDMNSQNSCDVSSLSQNYVLFKLSQMQLNNGYNYKLRSIFESHERSRFLKKDIKEYLLKIQGGRFNSKLRHKNRPDSIMNPWTNWLRGQYQYALPESAWSRLVPQKWRNRIQEDRVAQNKDLLEYASSKKTRLMFFKKQKVKVDLLEKQEQVDLLKRKKKIKKQYGYDLFAYQYLNYTDNQKSYIYGSKSPSYNTPKNSKELFDIMGDTFIQNYIGEDRIIDEKNKDRQYFHWRKRRMGMNGKRKRRTGKRRRMGMNGKRKKNSITNEKLLTPRFGFFSKVSAYKKNPWILPINFFFVPFYGNQNITNKIELALEKKEYASEDNLKSYLSKYYSPRSRSNVNKFRTDLLGEQNFLLDKYLGFSLNISSNMGESLTDNLNPLSLLWKLKNIKKLFIFSIKRGELDLQTLVRLIMEHTWYTEFRDTKEAKDYLLFFIEPMRISIKNYEQVFIYQTVSIALKHKRKIINSEKRRLDQKIRKNKDKNHYDLLVPENLLSTRRRRELRILTCLNPSNRKTMARNTIKEKENKNSCEVLTKKKDLDSDTKKLMNLKFFLWPNYRFEDLACMNRYWFDTHNGSRFSLLRLRMYPLF
uniref:Protein TIC 214 n=1 Tax=Lathyrus tingitanus TaxID=3862 RepID=A0A0F6NKZ7_LATTI|nr:hypothetical chloroplast RF19 [Lathyrus tingitanus]AIL55990.1 hypothetical chloroplast RF19 [Lathyrus tingitanus]